MKSNKLLWLERWAYGTNVYREASRKERKETGSNYFIFTDRPEPGYGHWISSTIRSEDIDKLPYITVQRLREVVRRISNKNLG